MNETTHLVSVLAPGMLAVELAKLFTDQITRYSANSPLRDRYSQPQVGNGGVSAAP